MHPLALTLGPGTRLSIESSTLFTDCDTVLAYQQYLCSTLLVWGSLQVRRTHTLSRAQQLLQPPCLSRRHAGHRAPTRTAPASLGLVSIG
jgi:hypothetical protein